MKPREWVAFGALGLIWGSSFLWIEIALREVGPVHLVSFRLLFGLMGLGVVLWLRRPPYPQRPLIWWALGILGITNTFLPFSLISWGQQFIDSAVASILNATVPLFTLVIAHVALQDDRITPARIAGLVSGFIGVVVLMSRDIGQSGMRSSLLGQGAVLAAAISYGASAVFARRTLREVSPLIQAFFSVVAADGMAWTAAFVLDGSVRLPGLPLTWLALAWLGLLGSCVAYLLYFYLLHSIGPTRASMVTYLFPVVGIVLGVALLGETVDLRLVLGAGLVASGIAIVNRRPQLQPAAALGD
jgi:drug/metabolite transporter (DMT)-like permease